MGAGSSSKYKLVIKERDELASAHKAKEKMLALLEKKHSETIDKHTALNENHLSVVAQCAAYKLELNHERLKAAEAERQLADAHEQLALLQKRVGEMTHGDPARDVLEREKIIAEMEALRNSIDAKNKPMRNVFDLVVGNLRREVDEIKARVARVDAAAVVT